MCCCCGKVCMLCTCLVLVVIAVGIMFGFGVFKEGFQKLHDTVHRDCVSHLCSRRLLTYTFPPHSPSP